MHEQDQYEPKEHEEGTCQHGGHLRTPRHAWCRHALPPGVLRDTDAAPATEFGGELRSAAARWNANGQ